MNFGQLLQPLKQRRFRLGTIPIGQRGLLLEQLLYRLILLRHLSCDCWWDRSWL